MAQKLSHISKISVVRILNVPNTKNDKCMRWWLYQLNWSDRYILDACIRISHCTSPVYSVILNQLNISKTTSEKTDHLGCCFFSILSFCLVWTPSVSKSIRTKNTFFFFFVLGKNFNFICLTSTSQTFILDETNLVTWRRWKIAINTFKAYFHQVPSYFEG